MNKWLIPLLGGLVLLAGAGWLWSRDEPLDPQAQAWLEQVAQVGESSEAYYQLLGLDAPTGSDPQAAGRQRLAKPAADEAPAATLTLPGDELCALGAPGCLQGWRDEPEKLQALLSTHAELLQRYETLLALADYRTLSPPAMDEPMPSYAALLKGNLLRSLKALALIEDKRNSEALALFEDDIRQLRSWLARADNLILKMTLVKLLAQDLDSLAALYRAELLPRPVLQKPLSPEERSLAAAMRREFALVANGLAGLLDRPDLGGELGLNAWQLRLLFKPHMSINDSLYLYARVAEDSRLDAQAFVQRLNEPGPGSISRFRHLRNPVGIILGDIAVPDFNRYLARLHDLDAKLNLFNRLGAENQAGGNPYNPAEGPQWNAEQQRLCFDGPLPDPQSMRCL
jgi:hypothetical protein